MFRYLLFLLLFLSSCSSLLFKSDMRNTPTNCFNAMWSTVDEHYSYFNDKHVNWDSVRTVYSRRIVDSMSQDSLYTVLSSMLHELKDGHVNLTTPYNRSRNWSWKDDFPDNYNSNFVYRNYMKRDYHMTGALPNQYLNDSIGYMRYNSFSSGISEFDLDYVLERFKNAKGLVIDVRDNGGGSMANIFKLMNRFVDKKTLVGYTQKKNGKNHNDFSQKTPYYAEPVSKRPSFTKAPIVVITNRGCYSATTHFAGFMSVLPNVTLVGDNTGGGGGLPISSDLPNGWQYRFSATYQTLPDGFSIEGGVPADVYASTGAKEELEGRDAIIEKAIEVIKLERIKNKK
jgi:Peptidase family S41/Tricorn protease C1 domain